MGFLNDVALFLSTNCTGLELKPLTTKIIIN